MASLSCVSASLHRVTTPRDRRTGPRVNHGRGISAAPRGGAHTTEDGDASTSTTSDLVGAIASGSRDLTRSELDRLTATLDLGSLCDAAASVRAAGPDPGIVTFSPKVFVPLTFACRDRCGYCTFAKDPDASDKIYMSVTQVIEVAERGRIAGATECLFTLGDRPEAKYPAAKQELRSMGFESTVDYLAHCAQAVLDKTGLLPHCNAGVLTRDELVKLRRVSASQGLMLESASDRLVDTADAAHHRCESKRPSARIRTLDLAGELQIPFTSGILVGIGETRAERLDALFAIRDIDRKHKGHVQEIIVQNFRAKEGTRMSAWPEPSLDELIWTTACARLIFGPVTHIQVPPNLTPEPDDSYPAGTSATADREGWRRLLRCGLSDWGGVSPGVTPDHVSPEAPWPHLSELARVTHEEGYALVPRLAAQARYVVQTRSTLCPHDSSNSSNSSWTHETDGCQRWIDPNVAPHVRVLADSEGLSRASAWCPGREESAVDEAAEALEAGKIGNKNKPWLALRSPRPVDIVGVDGAVFGGRVGVNPEPSSRVKAAIERLKRRGEGLLLEGKCSYDIDDFDVETRSDEAAVATLLRARGADFDAVCTAADIARREQCGDVVSYVVNRNINYTNVCTLSCAFCAFSKGPAAESLRGKPYLLAMDEISRRTAEAWARGATEVCMQGGIHPDFTGADYLEILKAAKAGAEGIHVHAFSPLEVSHGASTSGTTVPRYLKRLRDAGLGSLPGTAAEVLDDSVRSILCPDKLNTAEWLSVVSAAHDAGVPTTSTLMFGHVDTDGPDAWARHLLRLRGAHVASVSRNGRGFTEFVPLPFVHFEAPVYRKGASRRGPTLRECILAHAVGRLTLGPAGLTNIQASWVKMGPDMAGELLRAGCNDLGGVLMNESITRAAGATHGQEMSAARMEEIVGAVGRSARVRTTAYGDAPVGRREAAMRAGPLLEARRRTMGAVRRAFGSLLALGARHAGGPASGDVAPRLGTRLASLRAVHTRGDYLGSMGAPIVGGSLPGGMGNPSRLDRVPRERRRVYNARAWAVTSDHWRGLATVAGEDDDGGDGAGLAPDDSDDEAPPADADEEEDIAAFHDSLDDDTDDATSTVASDPSHDRPRREIQPTVTDRDVAQCPLDQLHDLVEDYHDVFDGGAAALALKKMATNGIFLVDTDAVWTRSVASIDTRDGGTEVEGSGDASVSSSSSNSSASSSSSSSREPAAGRRKRGVTHPSVDLLLSAVTRESHTMGAREATKCLYALMVMNVAKPAKGGECVRALNKRLGECALDMHGRHTAIALFSSAKLRREMRHVGQTRGQESLKPSDVALIDAVTRTARDDMSVDDLAKALRGLAIWVEMIGRKVGRLTRAIDAVNAGLARTLSGDGDGVESLKPHAAFSILSSHNTLAKHGASRSSPESANALTRALGATLDGDVSERMLLTAVNALIKARKASSVDEAISDSLRLKIEAKIVNFCANTEIAWFPSSALLALTGIGQTTHGTWDVSGSVYEAVAGCIERFEKRSTQNDAIAAVFAYRKAREANPNLPMPPVIERMQLGLDEGLKTMPPHRATRLLDRQCSVAMDASNQGSADSRLAKKTGSDRNGSKRLETVRVSGLDVAKMSPDHLDAAFRTATVGARELEGAQLASLARAAAWFYANESVGLTPPTDDMIAGINDAASALAQSGTLSTGTAAVLLKYFCELRSVGWRAGDPADGGVFKISNYALRDLLGAAEDGIHSFESAAVDAFTHAVRMLDGFNGDTVVGERTRARVESRMAELLERRKLLQPDSHRAREAYYFARGGVIGCLDHWSKTFANVPGRMDTALLRQFKSQIGDAAIHMTREQATDTLKLAAENRGPISKFVTPAIGALLTKALTDARSSGARGVGTKDVRWVRHDGEALVALTRSVSTLVRNMEYKHELRVGKRPAPKDRFVTPVTSQCVQSIAWNIIGECTRGTPLPNPGGYVDMLESLSVVGNWGRGRFFPESVKPVAALAKKLSDPAVVAGLSYNDVITAGKCFVALEETTENLAGVVHFDARVLEGEEVAGAMRLLRRRTLSENSPMTSARVAAETARLSFFLSKEETGADLGAEGADPGVDDSHAWAQWFERCERCVMGDADGAGSFLRALSFAAAKSPDVFARHVPAGLVTRLLDASGDEKSGDTRADTRVKRLSSLARCVGAGVDVPGEILRTEAAAAESEFIDRVRRRSSNDSTNDSGLNDSSVRPAGALTAFATLKSRGAYEPSADAMAALTAQVLREAPRWSSRFAHFDSVASLALEPEPSDIEGADPGADLGADGGADTAVHASPVVCSANAPVDIADVCVALRSASLRGEKRFARENKRSKSNSSAYGQTETVRAAAAAAHACARLAECGLGFIGETDVNGHGSKASEWVNVTESLVGGEDGVRFIESFKSVARRKHSGTVSAEVKRLRAAVKRLEAARREIVNAVADEKEKGESFGKGDDSSGGGGGGGGFFSSIFGSS